MKPETWNPKQTGKINFACLAVLMLCILGLKSESLLSNDASIPLHEFHISYSQMVVEGNQAMIRIRLFTDDLEKGLQQHYKDESIKLQVNPRIDSLFTTYLNKTLVLKQNDEPVPGVLAQSGEDVLNGFPVWWYTMSYRAPAPLDNIQLVHTTLMEIFDDQQNILKVSYNLTEKVKTYYFVRGASEITLRFDAE